MTDHTSNYRVKMKSCELILLDGKLGLKFQNFCQKCDFFLGV